MPRPQSADRHAGSRLIDARTGVVEGAGGRPLRVAVVHYWLVSAAGGEQVVKSILNVFPQADIFTLIADPAVASKVVGSRRVVTSFLQHIPFARKLHRKLLMLMPAALENLDMSGYDLIISSESGPAKGILPPIGALHVCYCHSPMRYIWDQFPEYKRSAGTLARLMMTISVARLRMWDVLTAARVDSFIANSNHIAARIGRYYRRDAAVIPPPVDVAEFAISPDRDDYYLITGRHVSYKRIDLAIEACNRLGRRLVITGQGPETAALKRLAGDNVAFVGQCSFDELKRYYARCRAFLMPGEEDFGIAPVEAMASGRPVLAYAVGGALDTVVPGTSGLLFGEASVDALSAAILAFEASEDTFDPAEIRAHAQQFSRANFERRFGDFVAEQLQAAAGRRDG